MKREIGICEVCRKNFTKHRGTALYCSSTCRSRAFRARERAATHGWDDVNGELLERYLNLKGVPTIAKKNVADLLFSFGVRAAELAIVAICATTEKGLQS